MGNFEIRGNIHLDLLYLYLTAEYLISNLVLDVLNQ